MNHKSENTRWDEFWHRGEFMLTLFRFTPTYRKIVGIFESLDISPEARILDVGCGSGKLSRYWFRRCGNVLGLDISDQALQFTKRHGVSVIKADVRRLPFPDGTFDLVYSDGLLEHFPDPDSVLSELSRISKNYVFSLVPRTTLFNKFLVAFFRIPKQYDMESNEWVKLHERFKFNSIEHGKAFTMYTIVCKKKS